MSRSWRNANCSTWEVWRDNVIINEFAYKWQAEDYMDMVSLESTSKLVVVLCNSIPLGESNE